MLPLMSRSASLYMRVIGDSWASLARQIQCLHASTSTTRAQGRLRITHGGHPVARLLAQALRLPPATDSADTRLTVSARSGCEHWDRSFDDRRIRTVQCGSDAGELTERLFGVVEFRFLLEVRDASLLYVQRTAAFACWHVRVPIPAACAPRVEAREDPAGSKRIQVEVRVVLPVIGLLISYAGIIEVTDTQP